MKNSAERSFPRCRIWSPRVPSGRHPEPEFRLVTFLPHQVRPKSGRTQQRFL